MESCSRGNRHPDDPRTSTGWVQLANHRPLVSISNEVVPHYLKAVWSWWRRRRSKQCASVCVCVLSSEFRRIWSERTGRFNICLTWWKIKYMLFVFHSGLIQFSTKLLFLSFFSLALPIWLYWVISFPLAYGRVAAAAVAPAVVAVWLHGNSIFAAVWQTIGGRPWERRGGLQGRGGSRRCSRALHKSGIIKRKQQE